MKEGYVMHVKGADLKPCPFCGCKAVLGMAGKGGARSYAVWCRGCGAAGRPRIQQRSVVHHWNKRADARRMAETGVEVAV